MTSADATSGRRGAPHGEKTDGRRNPPEEKGARRNGPARAPQKGSAPQQQKGSAPQQRGSAPAQQKGSAPQQHKAPAPQHKAPHKPKKPAPKEATGALRSGTVALIGRANVGKSTLLNAALGENLAIVSPTPQTTRDTLLGVAHRGSAELRMLDTPGLHKPKTELGRVMNHFAREAARAADVVVFVVDVAARGAPKGAPHPGDLTLLQSFKDGAAEGGAPARPIVLVLNKIDLVRDKGALLPLIEAFSKVLSFTAIVPIAARRDGEAERLMDVVADLLPEGPWQFGADDLTDRPTRYFAAEYLREQILRATRLEVPHAAAVTIERFVEAGDGPVEIDLLIHVERPGQKKILIGKGGETLKRIGTAARLRIKELLGRKVILKTWVRVTPAWRANAERLSEMGYQKKADGEGATFLLELPDDALPGVGDVLDEAPENEGDLDDEGAAEDGDLEDEEDLDEDDLGEDDDADDDEEQEQ